MTSAKPYASTVASLSVESAHLRQAGESLLFERALVAIAFFLGSGALISMFRLPDPEGDPWAGSAEDPLTQALWLALYAVMAFFLAPRWRDVLALMRRNAWIPALLIVVLLSTLWSPDPGLTLRRAVAITLGALYGYYLAIRFSMKQVLQLLAFALAGGLLLSVLFIVLLPSYGIYEDIFRGATWRGVFLHKQPLGRAAALGLIVFLALRLHRRHRIVTIGMASLAAFLVIGSASSTALLASALPAAVALAVPLCRRLGGQGSVGLLLVAAALVVGTLVLGRGLTASDLTNGTLSALGKDSTLTERTTVWNELESAVAEKPLLGYGVSGFWRGWEGAGSSEVWRQVAWRPVHAHNGYLDLVLELGFVGLVIFLLGLIVVMRQVLTFGTSGSNLRRLWPLLFLPFLLVESVAESVLVRPNSIYWILYVFTVAAVAQQSQHSEARFA